MDKNIDKLRKKTVRDQQKRIRPGECQKYMRLVLDSRFLQDALGQDILIEMNAAEMKYEIRSLPVPKSIIWERSVGQLTLVNGADACGLGADWTLENQVLRILNENDLQKTNKDRGSLEKLCEDLYDAYPDLSQTLVVPRLKDNSDLAHLLIDLQVIQQVNIVHIPLNGKEIVTLLRRYTKAIAEAPFKRQKAEMLGSFKKYLANDNKQCVRVEGTNGFGRLWQQHLNRLPLVTLEVAETIIAQYSCPKKLNDEFKNNSNAINTLADLKIKRSGHQAIQTDRRIGNVMSAKLYTLYNTRDPNTLI